MAVAFDAVGPSSAGTAFTASPGTWTHVNGGNGILVGVTIFNGSSNTVTGVTYGGVTVPFLGFIAGGTGGAGGIALYGLAGGTCPTGSNTVSVAFSDGGSNHNAGSVSVSGAGSLGTAVTAASAGTATSVSATITGTTTGGLIVSAASYGSQNAFVADANSAVQWSRLTSSSSGSDNGVMGTTTDPGGGSSRTVTWTTNPTNPDFWGIVAVEILPAGGGGATPAPPVQARPGKTWRRRFGTRRQKLPQPFPAQPVTANAGLATAAGTAHDVPFGTYITGLGGTGAGYFTDNHGAPRFLLGDNPWALIPNAGRWGGTYQTDIDTYCDNRGGQGYTAIYLDPLGNTENNGPFADGRLYNGGSTTTWPFTVNGTAASTASLSGSETIALNNPFWAIVDYFIAACARNGMTAMLNVAYEGPGDFAAGGAFATMTATQFSQYGAALAARYASTPNIIWMVGNDYFGGTGGTIGSGGGTPAADDAKFSNLLSGLRGGGDTHVISIHNYPESDARQDTGSSPGGGTVLQWGNNNAQFNGSYTYNCTYLGIEDAYGEASPLPVMQLDGYFYQNTGSTYVATQDRAFRQDAWWAITSGARGVSQGSESVWQWTSTSLAASSAGWFHAHNAANIRTVIESLPGWHTLVPDTSSVLVTAGRGTRNGTFSSGGAGGQYEPAFTSSFVSASRTPDTGSGSSLAVLYLPNATTVTIDTTKMVSGFAAYWVDPVTGSFTSATAGSTYNSTARGNNSQGDPDWVLVLQAPAGTTANAGLATAAGTAGQPSAATAPRAATAAATGTALQPSAAQAVPAGPATGTGTALQPAVSTSSGATANAGLATAAGAALQPSAAPGIPAGTATATGTAQQAAPAITAQAGLASAAGTAQSATPAMTVPAAVATGTGSALQPTVSTSSGATANAGLATGAGTAPQATASTAPAAATATAAGSAQQAAAAVGAPAGLATAAAVALSPQAAPGVTANAGLAAAAGTASGAALALRAQAAAATALAAALDGTVPAQHVPAASTATVTDPRDGTATVTDPRDGTATLTDPRDGTASVTATATSVPAVS